MILHIWGFIFNVFISLPCPLPSFPPFFPLSSCCKKSILTPCWNYFFDLLSVAFVIIITHNGLPQRILPFCLTAKLTSLCLEPCPPVNSRKTGINTSPCLRLAIPGDICKIKGLFTLFPHLPHLYSIKEPGIQTPIRWLF